MGGEVSFTSKQLQHALDSSIEILKYHDIPYALAFGTLLGFVRNGQMIDGDDDVDIFIKTQHFTSAVNAMKSHFSEKLTPLHSPYFRCFVVDGVQVDLYSVQDYKNNSYVCWEDRVYSSSIMFPFRKRGKYMVPNRPEDILKATYGENWKIPQDGKFDNLIVKSKGFCKRGMHLSPFGVSCVVILSFVVLLALQHYRDSRT